MSLRNRDSGIGFVESYSRYPPGSISATSCSHVSGFIATIMSTPPRRPKWPVSLIRTSNQVGKPWMFDGKMLRELAGIPIRRIDLAKSALALAEPDPLTLANLTTKSLTLWIAASLRFDCDAIGSKPVRDGYRLRHAGPACVMSRRNLRMSHAPVGHRSAHRPQCRQTSSSLTMIRPVFNESPI